jgi:myo-inositol-1(or 4)-monophosphatase
MKGMIKSNDLDAALDAARKGSEVIKRFRKKKVNIEYKGKHDLVTDADIATEKKIIEVLKCSFPDDEFLAEESSGRGNLPDGRIWIIDPIDGTTNFAYDFPVYCVSVALYENRQPKAGVVIEVNRNEEFSALSGKGAWLNGNPIRVSDLNDPDKALLGTGFPYNDYSLIDEYISLFRSLTGKVQGVRRPGAATYDLCCVAAGRFQGFYEYSLKAWDVAAAALIIREAGGVITDWKGEENWLFGERIIAGNEGVHRFLLDEIQKNISAPNLEKQ